MRFARDRSMIKLYRLISLVFNQLTKYKSQLNRYLNKE